MWSDDQKCDVFKTAKGMIKTTQHVIGESCIRNDIVLAVKKIARKLYLENLLNIEFSWYVSGRYF